MSQKSPLTKRALPNPYPPLPSATKPRLAGAAQEESGGVKTCSKCKDSVLGDGATHFTLQCIQRCSLCPVCFSALVSTRLNPASDFTCPCCSSATRSWTVKYNQSRLDSYTTVPMTVSHSLPDPVRYFPHFFYNGEYHLLPQE